MGTKSQLALTHPHIKPSTYKYWLLIGCVLSLLVSCSAAISQDNADYFPVRQNGKFGFMDQTGKVVIEPQFDGALVADGKTFSEGLAAVNVGDKWGYIDRTGKFVIPPKFKQRFPPSLFHDGLAQVEIREDAYGFIDKRGEFVIVLKFIEDWTQFSEGLAKAKKGDKFGFVDKTGRFVIQAQFAKAEAFKEGLAAVMIPPGAGDASEKFGFIDKTGKMVIEPRFKSAESFSEGLAEVTIDAFETGYIDKTGKVVIATQFDEAYPFSEGLAKIVMHGENFSGKAGFIDRTGKIVIIPQFEQGPGTPSQNYRGFNDGLAPVEVNRKSGYIDRTGKMIIAPQYDYASAFRNGIAEVTLGRDTTQKSYYIDKTGKIVRDANSQ